MLCLIFFNRTVREDLVCGKLGEGDGVVNLSWEGFCEFFAKVDHISDQGCAGSLEKVRIVVVLHEGSGKPVGVEGVSEFHVACEESFGCLFVGLSVVGRVGESSVAEEGFQSRSWPFLGNDAIV